MSSLPTEPSVAPVELATPVERIRGERSVDRPSLDVRRIERPLAADEVMSQLASLIDRGDLVEGDRLPSELQLAAEFGISRPVIREALRGLRSIGLITSKTGSGSYVSTGTTGVQRLLLLGRYPVTQLHEVRTFLEVPGARLAAIRATADQVSELRSLVGQMPKHQGRRYAEIDALFHVAVARCTANGLHARLIAELHELIVANSDLALSVDSHRHALATAEHHEIAEAIADHDAGKAELAMLGHLTRVSNALTTLHAKGEKQELSGAGKTRRNAKGSAGREKNRE
jgi:DNA-binding FadR family transcriptional regulator